MMIIDKNYMKYFLLLILCFFCTIISLAQGQIVRRKIIEEPKLVVPKKNEVARKSKGKALHRAYPYVRRYNRGICYKMASNYGMWLNSVVLSSEYTILNRTIMPTESEVYAYSESSKYLLDLDTNIKYYLKKSEIGVGKTNRRYFYESMFKSIPFKEYYEALPITARRIRLFDGEKFSEEIIYL